MRDRGEKGSGEKGSGRLIRYFDLGAAAEINIVAGQAMWKNAGQAWQAADGILGGLGAEVLSQGANEATKIANKSDCD